MNDAEAAALHERLFTIDTHCDAPTSSWMRADWRFNALHEHAVDGSQCDLPRMRAGGLDAIVMAVYVGQAARTADGRAIAREQALRYLDRAGGVIRENAHKCGLALTADDGPRLKAAGKRAIYLSIENAYSLGCDPANVERFHALGIRMMGLTHMLNNEVADSSTDPRGPTWGGLSPLGMEVVAECNRLGIVLDASHASDSTLRDLLEHSRAPVVLSHSGPRAVCDHPRNVGDTLLRALAAKGGVIQINALPISLVNAPGNGRTRAIADVLIKYSQWPLTKEKMAEADREYDRVAVEHPNPPVTFEDFIRHIEHAVQVAGIDHVGIGCDFDGGGGFEGLRDVGDFPKITQALLARGWNEEQLAKLWGGNTLRVMRAAEQVAAAG